MESLYARDTPTAQERKLKLAERNQVIEDGQVTLKPQDPSNEEQHPSEALDSLMETATESNANTEAGNAPNATANSADDTFGFNFSSIQREELEDQHWTSQGTEDGENPPESDKKTEEARLAELSGESSSLASNSEKTEMKATETPQSVQEEAPPVSCTSGSTQPRRAGVASVPRKAKPAITINTGSGSTGVGSKRPPPTPISPPTFSWNDILRVQNLIERCLQQYLSKNDILITLKEQANVDPAFTNVVWQKLEEQNPTFFRAYSLQLQLKEQIIAFNYLHESIIGKSIVNTVFPSHDSYSYDVTPISMDSRTFLRTPICSAKRTPAGKRAYNMNMYQLGSSSVGLNGTSSGMTTLPPPSPLPLPSPIKTDLDTHAFFT
ncbi:Enkurin [Phytophthora nicotianae]|uniref:Enkurin n=1 Tax=Phytophthora nicotianae TaxID=4792 RepID=A0A0W8DT68_PHYNI|nr:Enkurin [Phytophthora nicotianae]